MKAYIVGNATLQAVLTAGNIYKQPSASAVTPIYMKSSAGNDAVKIAITAGNNASLSVCDSTGTGIIVLSSSGTSYLRSATNGLVVGTNTKDSNALMEVNSTSLGFKVPTMTTAQKNAIGHSAGNIVFDTSLAKLCVDDGTAWRTITST